jgi:predicted nucleotide-binding protein
MNKEECIKALDDFKRLITLYSSLMPGDRRISNLRTRINHLTVDVQRIIKKAGRFKYFDYSPPPITGGFVMHNVNLFDVIFSPPYGMDVVDEIKDMIEQSLTEILKLEIFNLKEESNNSFISTSVSNDNFKYVFLVHGHDEGLKQSVARFLESLDLNPIILHEKANHGQTIIEKFEKYSNVNYAIVLMSPDDVGYSISNRENLNHRARQNVIFELGYFYGKIGRNKVCAIVKDNIESPSDNDGILYIPFDKSDGWKLKLGKELKNAGFNIDLNKIV